MFLMYRYATAGSIKICPDLHRPNMTGRGLRETCWLPGRDFAAGKMLQGADQGVGSTPAMALRLNRQI